MDEQNFMHDLGTISVEPPRRALGLDKMFLRATHWKGGGPSAPVRTPSPPASAAVLALPAPLRPGTRVSPLSGVFEYADLLPLVLQHLQRPAELAAATRVCRAWSHIARKHLYEHIWVRPWEDRPKEKVHPRPAQQPTDSQFLGLFQTLGSNPSLCELVRSLDVRFFPLALQGDARIDVEALVLAALRHMLHLERLVWTVPSRVEWDVHTLTYQRDRSMSADLFAAITGLPRLAHLELSGKAHTVFDPAALRGMAALRDLRVMMPDQTFRTALPSVVRALDERPEGGLQGLALICKNLNLINDTMLKDLAPQLSSLKRLQLIGCTRVTRSGVYAVLEEAEGMEELILDAPPHSDLVDFSRAPEMPALHTFSLSFPGPHQRDVLEPGDIPLLRPAPTVRALELTLSANTSSGERHRALSVPALHQLLAQADFGQLTRLALLNIVVDSEILSTLLHAAPRLDELYITVATRRTLQDNQELTTAPLRIFHANAPEATGPHRAHLAELAAVMPAVEQIGSLNRVYEVHRRWEAGQRIVELARWSQIVTPGYFQVWRP